MMVSRWEVGRAEVEDLLRSGSLQRVTPDREAARQLIQTAQQHLKSAGAVSDDDPEAAIALLYDACRKACSGLLETQGLRATSQGGHIAVREAVMAQFGGSTGGNVLKALERLRRRRNDMEYPDSASSVDASEVGEALERAREIVDYAGKVVESLPVF
jgi:hypothetical protein